MKPLSTIFRVFLFASLITTFTMNGQVGIGTTNPQGALDISGAYGGLVMPRTNLINLNDITTVLNPQGGGAPVKGTFIYDLGTFITEGFYYYDGSKWQNLVNSDSDTFLGSTDQTLTGNRDINLSGYDLNFDVANNGSKGLTLDTDYLALSRDAGAAGDGLIATRGGLSFNIDSNDNNSNDNEYFSWGQDGGPGSGTGDSNYDELMRLDNTGLGLGTNNPNYLMHVVETQTNLNIAKFEAPDFPIFGGFIIEDNAGNNTSKFVISPGNIANNSAGAMAGVPASNNNSQNSVTFDCEGSTYDIYAFMEGEIRPGFDNLTTLGAPNHRFIDLYLVNNPTVTSDVRLKKNIVETNYGLETVMQITPVSYELIDDVDNDVHLGFKAQEIQQLIPEIINTAPDTGTLSMVYAEMIPVLTKAIQELNDKLDTVIRENETLRAENASLTSSAARD